MGLLEAVARGLLSRASYYVSQLAPTLAEDAIILVCLSGRGDKDVDTVAQMGGRWIWGG